MLFIFILLFSLVVQFFLPWWVVAPIAAALSFWKGKNATHVFVSAYLAVFLVWAIMSLSRTIPNGNLLLDRVIGLFGLSAAPWSRVLIVIATGFVGGIVAATGGLAGFYWKQLFNQERK